MNNEIVINNREKNYGIELLRILSTIMIITLHILGQGGLLYNATPLSIKYEIIWLLEIASYCCVNCFGLISGYIGGKNHNYKKLVLLWFKVFLCQTLISTIFCFIKPSQYFNLETIKNSFLFLTQNTYWYFTAYFILYIFAPYLEILIEKTTEKEQKKICSLFLLFFSIIPTFTSKTIFNLENGYSFIWLGTLYLIGGFIRKNNWFSKQKKSLFLLIYFSSILFTWFLKFVIEFIKFKYQNIKINEITSFELFVSYLSPTIFLAAISIFLFFIKLNILLENKEQKKNNRLKIKLITILSSSSFGIYILHTHPIIWKEVIFNRFVYLLNNPPFIMLIFILLYVVFIYTICILIEKSINIMIIIIRKIYLKFFIFPVYKKKKIR